MKKKHAILQAYKPTYMVYKSIIENELFRIRMNSLFLKKCLEFQIYIYTYFNSVRTATPVGNF